MCTAICLEWFSSRRRNSHVPPETDRFGRKREIVGKGKGSGREIVATYGSRGTVNDISSENYFTGENVSMMALVWGKKK